MAGPAWRELRLALDGAVLLARGDARGLGCFDASLGGFWRSFRAAAICYPPYLMLMFSRVSATQWTAAGGARVAAVATIEYVISWTAFPLIILKLCDWLRREDRFFAYMVAENWCQVPQIVVFSAIVLARGAGLVDAAVGDALGLAAAAAALVYEWFIARAALAVSVTAAMLVVAADLLLATVLTQVGESLY